MHSSLSFSIFLKMHYIPNKLSTAIFLHFNGQVKHFQSPQITSIERFTFLFNETKWLRRISIMFPESKALDRIHDVVSDFFSVD